MARSRILGTILALLVAGCGGDDAAQTTATTAPTTTAAPVTTEEPSTTTEAPPVVLEVSGPSGTVSLTMDGLVALPVTEGWGGGKSSTGTITVPELHRGVSLADLAALVGGLGEEYSVAVTAKDGYSITFSYDQAAGGAFIAYDPGSGAETETGPLTAIVAYERGGAPIPADEDGPLRLAVVSADPDQVVDGHWTVKWVTALALKEASEEWVLALGGDGTETIDRATFDSCLACHTAEWSDEDGRTWSGVPLYLIAGRIDGGEVHGDGAYDRARAETGYLLQVTAADGFSGEIPSSAFHLSDQVILAALLDGAPLEGDDAPLRVVGPELSGRQQVGQVVEITAVFDGGGDDEGEGDEPAPSDALPPPDARLTIGGAVGEVLDLDAGGLAAFGAVAADLEHPGNGVGPYAGIPILRLLEAALVAGDATTLTVIAGDGYSIDLDLAEVTACDTCLLAFDGDVLSLAMPGFPGSAWVKDVVAFELA